MTRFQVDTEELERAIARLAAMGELCERLLTEVDALAGGVSADWSGEANRQFSALKTEWAQGARMMSEGIAAIHRAATTAHANYSEATAAAQRVW